MTTRKTFSMRTDPSDWTNCDRAGVVASITASTPTLPIASCAGPDVRPARTAASRSTYSNGADTSMAPSAVSWARSTSASSAPCAASANGRRRQQGAHRREEDARLTALGITPGRHRHRRTGHRNPLDLAQRVDRVGGVLHRVERRHGVEGVVVVGQLLKLPLAEVGVGQPGSGHGEKASSRVDAGDDRAALGRQLQRKAGATAHVEETRAVADVDGIEGRLVQRRAARLLQRRPHLGRRAPQCPLDRC
jgi:hypothetical protein